MFPRSHLSSIKTCDSTENEANVITSSLHIDKEITISLANIDESINISESLESEQIDANPSTPNQELQTINSMENNVKQQKKIRRLEKRLRILSKTIRALEQKDMSLDEMKNCDLYVVESNLKKRAYQVNRIHFLFKKLPLHFLHNSDLQ